MADRWSLPSGSVGQQRFHVWPDGADSYDHVELAYNWDHIDGIVGSPPSGQWPPTEGINGGIYKLIKDLTDRIDDLELPPEDDDDPILVIDDKYIIGYGTTFPASPPDGKHFVLVSSTTAPTWAFHCRYVAAIGTHKWVVNGVNPILASAPSQQDIDSLNLSITVPRSGIWKAQGGGTIEWNPDPGGGGHLYLNLTGGVNAFLDAGVGNYAGNRFAHGVSVTTPVASVTTAGSITLSGAATGGQFSGGNSYKRVSQAWLKAWPQRLS